MKKLSILIIITFLLLTIATGCSKQVFDGSRTSNDKQFIMDYSVLNTTETHEMELKEGTNIDVVIENKSGRLDVLVANTNGEEIYRGDNASSGSFSLEIPKTGTYKFSVTGNKAKGGVSFIVEE